MRIRKRERSEGTREGPSVLLTKEKGMLAKSLDYLHEDEGRKG